MQATARSEKNEHTNYLMNCLRHRVNFPELENANNDSSAAILPGITNPRKIVRRLAANKNKPNEGTHNVSLYDTLLLLIDEFDITGVVEIFRLLLERRSAIPLFIPASKKQHLDILKYISLDNFSDVSMGEDKSLLRVAVVSCREKSQSQSSELLKGLFHIDSVHYHDFKKRCITSESITAEIANGCLIVQEKVHHLMVVHVIGDFRPLWTFIMKFADYLLFEDATDEKESFGPVFLDKNPQIKSDMARTASSRKDQEIPFVCVWKPSTVAPDCIYHQEDVSGFNYYFLEGQFGSATIEMLREEFFSIALLEGKEKERTHLHDILMLDEDGYSPLVCSMPFDVKSAIIADSTPNLSKVKKNHFLMQKNYEYQAEHEENLCRQRLEKEKKKEEARIRRHYHQRRIHAHQVPLHPLLLLLLDLLTNDDPCVRVLAVRIFDKTLSDRSEQELRPQLQFVKKLYCEYQKQSEKSNGDKQAEELLKDQGKKLNEARTELNESVLNIEHLWRELSHYYTAMKPGHLPPLIANIPQLAAQHLMDGFSIELLDGDSNR